MLTHPVRPKSEICNEAEDEDVVGFACEFLNDFIDYLFNRLLRQLFRKFFERILLKNCNQLAQLFLH